ncbi:hypothetical protein [Schlesneria sp. T3-172]|uniref:hypothetical protein n=1 Tax=Schlesneria sphaerica TaxID=3373610 RepID=UPI0037C4F127
MSPVARRQNCCKFIVAIGLVPSLVLADPKSSGPRNSAVDVIVLKSGRTLRGLVASSDPKAYLTLVVSRDWLSAAHPQGAAAVVKTNVESRERAWIQTRDRIRHCLDAGDVPAGMSFFFKQELERLDRLLADPPDEDPDFLWYDIRPASIARMVRAQGDRRLIATHAWNARIAHVETREVASLQKELTDLGIPFEAPAHEFIKQLPGRVQSDAEWAARCALLEHGLVEELNFQGTGDVITRTKAGKAADLVQVIPQLLEQQWNSLLKDLGNDFSAPKKYHDQSRWLANAIRQAQALKRRGFRVTRLEIDPVGLRVRVDSRFVVQVAEGDWRTIWSQTEVGDAAQPRPQAEARIEDDPQVKSIKQSLGALGLVDAESMRRAIRFGAATMSTQQKVDTRFEEFRETYTKALDGPPIQLYSISAGATE